MCLKPDPDLDDAMANALKTKSEDGEEIDFGKGLMEPTLAEVKVEEFSSSGGGLMMDD